jgi:hypothetical protein
MPVSGPRGLCDTLIRIFAPDSKDVAELKTVGAEIGIGVAIGVGIGMAMENLGAGIAIGIAIGAAIAASRQKKDH